MAKDIPTAVREVCLSFPEAEEYQVSMKTLFQLNTSLFSNGGQSSRLADQFVAAWRERNAGART